MSYSKIIINEKWQLNSKIGEGSFGIIFSAHNVKNKEELVAIKLENIDYNKRLLQVEISALKRLQRSRYVPRFFESGSEQNFNFLVMELLGSNLTDIKKQQPDKKFGLNIGCKICIELIHSIQSVHELRYIHRDIKPSNFVIGKNNLNKIYLIDFGLAKCYTDKQGVHLNPRTETGFRGTARYASITSHNQEDLSRRDDMWSLFYVLVELIVGQLPWHDLKEKDQIKLMKLKHTPEELVKDLPSEFMSIIKHIQSLSFFDTPDYEYIRSLLYGIIVTNNSLDLPFPWEEEKNKRKSGSNEKFKLVSKDNMFSLSSNTSLESQDKAFGTSQPKISHSQSKSEDNIDNGENKIKSEDIQLDQNGENNKSHEVLKLDDELHQLDEAHEKLDDEMNLEIMEEVLVDTEPDKKGSTTSTISLINQTKSDQETNQCIYCRCNIM